MQLLMLLTPVVFGFAHDSQICLTTPLSKQSSCGEMGIQKLTEEAGSLQACTSPETITPTHTDSQQLASMYKP